jgi:hypothetical protein
MGGSGGTEPKGAPYSGRLTAQANTSVRMTRSGFAWPASAQVPCYRPSPDGRPMQLALFLFFAGCVPADADADGDTGKADCDDALTVYTDADGDGFGDPASGAPACALAAGQVTVAEDCDDADPAVNPDNVEVCDELDVDEDCDDLADDADPTVTSASEWYLDSDGDHYGDPTRTEQGCEPPPGYVADGTDCDDAQADVNPSAWEYCDGEDDDCDGAVDGADAVDVPTWYADADHDGHGDPGTAVDACDAPLDHVADAADCDDARADVSPSLAEICDEADTDEDCDGLADDADPDALADGMSTFYADADGDTCGDATASVTTCDAPLGHVADATDCDDTFADINPLAVEVCDADDADEDCDGSSDDGDTSVDATTRTTFYRDDDRDGYGTAAETYTLCDMPDGFAASGGDCDDASATVRPGASEVCDAADADEDCDGLADDADGSVLVTTYDTFYLDADGDGYGDDSVPIGACDAPAGHSAIAGDCDAADPAISPDASEICGDAVDENCDGATDCVYDVDDAARKLRGEASYDALATSVASAGDQDGDGDDDFIFGSYFSDRGGSSSGAAWVIAGGETGDLPVSSAAGILVGEDASDFAGYCVAGVGDRDGDGYDDMVVGAAVENRGGTAAGTLYLVRGPVTGTVDLSTAYAMFTGEAYANVGGTCRPAGDVDGDGTDDVLVGGDNYRGTRGGAWILTSTPAGTTALSTVTGSLSGESSGDAAGWALDGAGDVDADGYDDIVVGSHGDDDGGSDAGAGYLVLGPHSGAASLSTADAKLQGENAGDEAGRCVRGVGDLDGDGYDDIAVGAPSYDTTGVVYLVLGPVSGTSSLTSADVRIEGTGGYLGDVSAVEGRDLDGDGLSDLVLGDTEAGDVLDEGEVYLMRAPFSGSYTTDDANLTFRGRDTNTQLGRRIALVGSQDGLGSYDLLATAAGDDEGGSDAGAVYLFSLTDF